MTVNEYQNLIGELLHKKLNLDCCAEWRSKINSNVYSPVVDVAVGPFAIQDGLRYTDEHLHLIDINDQLFYNLAKCHLINLTKIHEELNENYIEPMVYQKMEELKWSNMNGRCFIAIEIENKVSRKHLMGGAINCAALGKVGIAVGFNEEKHRAFLNLYRYFSFLQEMEKPTFNAKNLLVISKEQLLEVLS